MHRWTWKRRTEAVLLTTAILCAGYSASVQLKAKAALRESAAFTQHPGSLDTASPAPIPVDADAGQGAPATVMGKLEVGAIGLAVPIMSNYETSSLLKGIGYIPGTARPGGLGTLGLAGHRDTYFRPLSRIKKGMDIRVADATGTYHYQVDSTEVVKPDDVAVLDIRDQPALTLVTCYPFHYIGAAPFRFIVHAHLLSVLPD